MSLSLAAALFAFAGFQDAAAALVERLRSEKIEEREAATRALKELGRAAFRELERAALDADVEVAAVARHLLRVVDLREKLPARLRQALPGIEDRLASEADHLWSQAFLDAASKRPALRREDVEPLAAPAVRGARTPEEKERVCRAVGRKRCRSAIPEVVRLLSDRDPHVRRGAALSLTDLGARDAWADIARLLDHDETADDALHALMALGATDAVPAIAKVLRHSDESLRGNAAMALGYLRAREAVPDLVRLLGDQSGYARVKAAEALAQMRVVEEAPRLVELLRASDDDERSDLIRVLGWMGAKSGIPAVTAALRDECAAVRASAARTLGRLGATGAVPGLTELLRDREPAVRRAAVEALGDLGKPDLRKLLEDPDAAVRETASRVLWRSGIRDGLDPLTKLLRDPSPRARLRGAQTLGSLQAKEALPELVATLKDDDASVRAAAAVAVTRLGSREGVSILLAEAERAEPEGVEGDFYLYSLNALRRPELWRRLAATPLSRDLEGSTRTLWEFLAREAGLRLELGPGVLAAPEPWMSTVWRLPGGGQTSLLDALGQSVWGPLYDVVLEDDRLRILRREDALEFWKLAP